MLTELPDPLLRDRFECLEQLDEAASWRSWLVVDRRFNRRVVLDALWQGDPCTAEDLAPARALIGSRSDQVAEVLEAGVDSRGLPYTLRRPVEGVTLKRALEEEAVTLPTALEIVRQCLLALGFLHNRGAWAQNLAPRDIVLNTADGALQVTIADPGVFRKWQESPGATAAAGLLVGRLKYAAPEQFDESPAGPASGIYVLGLICYEMLTGHFPIRGESASSLIAGHLFRPPLPFDEADPEGRLSPEIRGILSSMLAKSSTDRFQSAEEALSFLAPIARAYPPTDLGSLSDLVARAAEEAKADRRKAGSVSPLVDSTAEPGTQTVRLSAEKIAEIAQAASNRGTEGPTAMIRQVRDQVDEEDLKRRARAEERERATGEQVRNLLSEAQSVAQTERFDRSLELVDEALVIAPDHAEALMLRASLDACLRIQQEEQKDLRAGSLPPVPAASSGSSAEAPVSSPALVSSPKISFSEEQTVRLSTREIPAPPPSGRPASDEPPGPDSGLIDSLMAEADAAEDVPTTVERPLPAAEVTASIEARATTPEPEAPEPQPEVDSVEAFGSVTLPMSTIEEARRVAMARRQQEPAQSVGDPGPGPPAPPADSSAPPADSSAPPADSSAPPTSVKHAGSMTVPMAVVQEAKRRFEQDSESGPRRADPSKEKKRPSFGGSEPDPEPVKVQAFTPAADRKATTPPVRGATAGGAKAEPGPAERTLSDFGFGEGVEPEPEMPSVDRGFPNDRFERRPKKTGSKALMWLGLILGLAVVFGLSFHFSGRLTHPETTAPDPLPAAAAQDVAGTDLPPGWLALNASPWGEITGVIDSGQQPVAVVGPPYTPKRLELTPGTYKITLEHPSISEPVEVSVEIETGQVTRRHVDLGLKDDELLSNADW